MAGRSGRYPVGRAGNYVAPVDTSGMDEEMKQTLQISPGSKPRPKPRPAKPPRAGAVKRGKR